MSRTFETLSLEEIVERFHDTFRASENTVLRGGFHEPLYVPSVDEGPDEIRFTCDWVRSALHEIAHWCLAGRARRRTAWNRRRLATSNYTTHEPAANSGGSPNGSHTERAMIAVR